jgi:DNA-binding response OmpR family regulator
MRILLVDDEEELVSTLSERLSFRGITADWVTRAEDVWPHVEAHTYDLAVLDIKMPKMGGIELKQKLGERFPHMKFIFLTGHGSEEDYKAALAEAGPDGYQVKPIHIDTLIKKMKKVLQQ